MRTLKSAAARLAAAGGLADLFAIISELGFTNAPVALDAEARAALSLPNGVAAAAVAAGRGTLRALLLELQPESPLRETLERVASRLASRLPHVLWLVVVTARSGAQVGVAAWTFADRRTPRVVALVAERTHVVDSDAETLLALAAAAEGSESELLTHARWVEVLGRDALGRRFYRELERRVKALADGASAGPTRVDRADREEIALLYASRLLFLAFLQAKSWLDGDRAFLEHRFDECMSGGGAFHRRVLRPLFFGTLNTRPSDRSAAATAFGRIPFLNGGLFTPTGLERRTHQLTFDDEAFGALFGELLSRYRFTAREDRSSWSEAAIDPEMLGRAFESLMASRARRESGAFFTPQSLVEHVGERALTHALTAVLSRSDHEHVATLIRGEQPPPRACAALLEVVTQLAVLDPACGSGAFLVYALERLADLARLAGDMRSVSDVRRAILTGSIFGVDRNPTAVWLCELRLWLSVVIESSESDPLCVPTLPNLDRNIRVGDSLAGDAFDVSREYQPRASAMVRKLRERYARAFGPRKESLARALESAERERALERVDSELRRIAAIRRERLLAQRTRDLFGERHGLDSTERVAGAKLRARAAALRRERARLLDGGALPFAFPVHFADVGDRGGFDVILGNPPWVRLHRIPASARVTLRERYSVYREAGWDHGARVAHAGRGFAAQVDLAALFVERSLRLLRSGGTMALLLPAKLWRSLAGGGVRRLLHRESTIYLLEDWSEARATFDAAVYPSVVVARHGSSEERDRANGPAVAIHIRDRTLSWCLESATNLALDGSAGSPWLLLPPPARVAFNRLASISVPLAESALGRPHLGVKCGCNDAFVVASQPVVTATNGLQRVSDATGRAGCIESSLLRPVLRGEEVRAWSTTSRDLILWTHAPDGRPRTTLPSYAARWLAPWRGRLERRADFHGRAPWWSVFRVESASCALPRVVWADLARVPRAAVLPAGDQTVPLNSCYTAICSTLDDAHALAAILNSPVAAAWLDPLAEPARGSYRRYMGWTIALLPIPTDWPRARSVLAPLGARACAGQPAHDAELLGATLDAYGISKREIEPLLSWRSE